VKKLRLFGLLAGLFLCLGLSSPQAQAVGVWDACTGANSSSAVCADKDKANATSLVKNIINLMLFGLGIAAVILIIHSGLKYVSSRGDPANIKSAKDTLLYAVIGLIVALSAFAIVNFVLTAFK
jgi:uncharacterized membrane protein